MNNRYNYRFYKNQIGLLSLRLDISECKNIKKHNLINSFKSAKRFTLNSKFGDNASNLTIYLDDKHIIIRLYLPDFMYGHDYCKVEEFQLKEFSNRMKNILGIDISNAEVLNYEYGAYEHLHFDSKTYLKNITGLEDWKLTYSKSYQKVFANSELGLDYTIYDAGANKKNCREYRYNYILTSSKFVF